MRPYRPTDPIQGQWLQGPVWDVITAGWSERPEQRCKLSVMRHIFLVSSPITVGLVHLNQSNLKEGFPPRQPDVKEGFLLGQPSVEQDSLLEQPGVKEGSPLEQPGVGVGSSPEQPDVKEGSPSHQGTRNQILGAKTGQQQLGRFIPRIASFFQFLRDLEPEIERGVNEMDKATLYPLPLVPS